MHDTEPDLDGETAPEGAEESPSLPGRQGNQFQPGHVSKHVPASDEERCQHVIRATNERCKNRRRAPFNVCRFHGARALLGPATTSFKHGRYSKMLPERLRQNFVAALKDPELEQLRRQIALTETREIDLLTRLETGDRSEAIQKIGKALSRLRFAIEDNDKAKLRNLLRDLDESLQKADNDDLVWREIHTNMEMRRRLVETERKRSEFLQTNMTPDLMSAFVAQVVLAVGSEISNRATLSRISDNIRSLAFGKRFLLEEDLEAEFNELKVKAPGVFIDEKTLDELEADLATSDPQAAESDAPE